MALDLRSPRRLTGTPARERITDIGVLHVWVLASFAVAQPLLDILGKNPEFFVAHLAGRMEVLAFVLALVVVVPAPLLLFVVVAGLGGARVQRAVVAVLVGLLVALAVLPAATALGDGAAALVPAVAAGAAAGVAYARAAAVRSVLTVLTPAPLLFAALFLVASPASGLVLRSARPVPALDGSSDVPVVMLILDELPVASLMTRNLTVDAERFPAFASLAQDATWYRNTTTRYHNTHSAVATILSGIAPPPGSDTVANIIDYPHNLLTALAGSHDTTAWEMLTRLCPVQECDADAARARDQLVLLAQDTAVVYAHVVVPPPWAAHLPPITDQWAGFAQTPGGEAASDAGDLRRSWDQVPRWNAFLRTITSHPRPPLYLLHAVLPHQPWHHLPSGARYDDQRKPPGLVDSQVWPDNDRITDAALRRHLLQLEFTDALLGRTLATLREHDLYDDALVVVVADHGVAFTPGTDNRIASLRNLPEIARVPLFIKAPHQTIGRIDDRPVQTVDILPTVLDLLNVDVPWSFDGVSLVDPSVELPPQRPRPFVLIEPEREIVPEPHQIAVEPLVEHIHQRFPAENGGVDPYGADFAVGLMGRMIADLPVSTATGAHAELLGDGTTRTYDPAAGHVPAMVSGIVTRDGRQVAAPLPVVATLNDRVVAAGWTYPHDGAGARFDLVLPEHRFQPGTNIVAVYQVDDHGGRRVLIPLTDAP